MATSTSEYVYSEAMIRIAIATNRIYELEAAIEKVRTELENVLTSLRPDMPDEASERYWKRFYELVEAA